MVSLPTETLTIELASDSGSPIASKTWEGLRAPEEQAEPEETQKPLRSRAARIEKLSKPGREKQQVLEILLLVFILNANTFISSYRFF